jgi:hypothetical protein
MQKRQWSNLQIIWKGQRVRLGNLNHTIFYSSGHLTAVITWHRCFKLPKERWAKNVSNRTFCPVQRLLLLKDWWVQDFTRLDSIWWHSLLFYSLLNSGVGQMQLISQIRSHACFLARRQARPLGSCLLSGRLNSQRRTFPSHRKSIWKVLGGYKEHSSCSYLVPLLGGIEFNTTLRSYLWDLCLAPKHFTN